LGIVNFQQLEEQFFVTLDEPDKVLLAIPATELQHEVKLAHLLDTYGSLIHTTERAVAAALFLSWYAGICAAMQKTLYQGDEMMLDLSLSNVIVQLALKDDYPVFSFRIREQRFIPVPPMEQDKGWRKHMLRSFYSSEVTPIIQVLSQQLPMNASSLWGQIMNVLQEQLDGELGEVRDEDSRMSIASQFRVLTHDVDASAFGLRKNPFNRQQRFVAHPNHPDQRIPLKMSCCLAYRLEADFGYCYTCPRLKEQDRACMRANG